MSTPEPLGGAASGETIPDGAFHSNQSKADDDRGMARERTRLAWHRTGLSLLAVGVGVLRAVTVSRTPVMVAAAVVGLGALMSGWALLLAARGATGRLPHSVAGPPTLRRVAVCIEAMAVAAAVLALFPLAG